MDDGSNSFCSAALLDAREWTEVTKKRKTGRPGRPHGMQGSTERSQEASHVKSPGIDLLCGTYRMRSFVV